MPDYMLLLYERPELFADVSADQMQRVISKYVAWRARLGSAGKLAGGSKLKFENGRVLEARSGGVAVRDGPFTEAKDVIGGYFVITASDYAEAVELSRDCPHLEFGGKIVLREIEPT